MWYPTDTITAVHRARMEDTAHGGSWRRARRTPRLARSFDGGH